MPKYIAQGEPGKVALWEAADVPEGTEAPLILVGVIIDSDAFARLSAAIWEMGHYAELGTPNPYLPHA